MLEPTIKTAKTDMRSLLRDAQDMFRQATSTSGSKADELRNRGLNLLDTAIEKAQDAQYAAVNTSKEFAETADDFVRDNPWRSIAISASVGLVIGLLLTRR